MPLELATLLFVAALLALLLGVGFLVLPAMRRREPALVYWGAANVAIVAAAATGSLVAARTIPLEVGAIGAPAVMLLGAALYYGGVRVFDRRPPLLGLHLAAAATLAALLAVFTFVHDSAQIRVVMASAASVSYGCVALYTLLRPGDGGGGRRLLAAAWGGLTLFGVTRTIATLLNDPGRSVLEAGGVHTLAGLVLVVVVVLFNGAGLIMLNGRLTGALERLAHTDALTETLSRGAFLSRAQRALDRSSRNEAPAGVVVFDLDHFKEVNDRWGHPAGDAVLRGVATAVRDALRPADLFGRIGGEEFAVMLADTPATGVRVVAERLRRKIEQCEVRSGRRTMRVTASVGLAVTPTDGATLEALLARADEALYAAKAAGRNRVRAAEGSEDVAAIEAPAEALDAVHDVEIGGARAAAALPRRTGAVERA